MAPAVFVKKKTGDLRICVDYWQEDLCPLPLPDEFQNWLAGAKVLSTLNMWSGYWQEPINPEDKPKTAFCPGPDMDLFACTIPALSGKTVMLVHSAGIEEHRQHLKVVFQRLRESGFTMKGSKCSIAVPEVRYLGHVFSWSGMKLYDRGN